MDRVWGSVIGSILGTLVGIAVLLYMGLATFTYEAQAAEERKIEEPSAKKVRELLRERTARLLTYCNNPDTFLHCKARFEELENLTRHSNCRFESRGRGSVCVPEGLCTLVEYPLALGAFVCETRMGK